MFGLCFVIAEQYLDDTLQKDALSRPKLLQSLPAVFFLEFLPFSFESVQPGGVQPSCFLPKK